MHFSSNIHLESSLDLMLTSRLFVEGLIGAPSVRASSAGQKGLNFLFPVSVLYAQALRYSQASI